MTTFKPELKAQQLQVLESRKHDLAITIRDNDFQPLFSYFMKIIIFHEKYYLIQFLLGYEFEKMYWSISSNYRSIISRYMIERCMRDEQEEREEEI